VSQQAHPVPLPQHNDGGGILILVFPAERVACSLQNTLHSEEDQGFAASAGVCEDE